MTEIKYDLEIEKLTSLIIKNKYKKVLIQLPDGLKPKAKEICDEIEKLGCEVLIWFSSCYGACDIPVGLSGLNVDLFVQFGHSKFKKEDW